MLTTSELADARGLQATLLTDTVTVDREDGTTWDPTEGQTVTAWQTIYPTGPGRLVLQAGTPVVVAGEVTVPQVGNLTLPHDSAPLEPGDRVQSAGLTVWVESDVTGPIPTARRYQVKALT